MNSNDERIALWRQLQSTAAVVQSVRGGMSGTLAIDAAPLDLRGAVQALAFHVWRNLGRAQALRSLLAPRTPPPAVDALLCVALALVWNQERAPYDAFTLVNQTVEAAKKMQQPGHKQALSTRAYVAFCESVRTWSPIPMVIRWPIGTIRNGGLTNCAASSPMVGSTF